MSSFNDILNNLKGGIEVQGERAFGTITEAWDSFKNLDSISLPNFDVKNLFGNIAQMTSKFSDAGSGDTTQTDILSGLTSIWSKDSPELQKIAGGETKVTTKYVMTDEALQTSLGRLNPKELSEEQYNKLGNSSDDNKIMKAVSDAYGKNVLQPMYNKVTTEDDYNPVTEFQGMNTDSHDDYYGSVVDTSDADRLNFQTPDWSYADFINERAIFQKSLQNPVGEQGWFYFKIFFNFTIIF